MNRHKLILLTIFLLANYAFANTSRKESLGECQNAKILDQSLLNKIPWNALYPIKLAGITVSKPGQEIPKDSSSQKACTCEDDLGVFVPGVTTSIFEPSVTISIN